MSFKRIDNRSICSCSSCPSSHHCCLEPGLQLKACRRKFSPRKHLAGPREREPRQFCNKDSEKLSPVINYDREPTLISQWRKRYKKKLVKSKNNSCRAKGGGGHRLYLYFVPSLVKYMEPNDFVLLTSKACMIIS